MSIIKQLAGETAIYGISSILSRILHFVLLTPYLTRVFENQADYGKYTDLYVYAAFLLVVFTYRMETAYFRFGSRNREQEGTAFSSASLSILITTSVLVSLILLLKEPIAILLEYESEQRFISYFACIIGFDAIVAIPFARLRLQNRPFRFASIKLLGILLNLLLIFFFLEGCPLLINQGYSWWSNIYAIDYRLDLIFISNLIASSMVGLLLFPEFIRVTFTISWSLLKKMLLYAMPLVLVGLAAVINQSSAVPFIKYLLPGTTEENMNMAGIYAGAAKLAILMNLFTQAFNYAAEPFFFKKAKDADAKLVYADTTQAFALAASAGFLVILLFLDIFQYFLGENYREGLFVVPFLLLSYWFLGLYYNFSIWYKVTDKTHYGAWISIGGSILTIVIAVLFLRANGIIVMAVAALVCYTFMALAGYLTGRKNYRIPYSLGKIFGYLGVAIFLGSLGAILQNQIDSFPLSLLLRLMLFLAYLMFAYAMDPRSIHRWIGSKNRT